jgi:hypothetical protein
VVRPETVIGEDDPVALIPSGVLCTTYPVIADPPTLAGAVKATEAVVAVAAVAVPIVGAFGA